MSEKDTLYARWLSGDLEEEEANSLKSSGELEELEAIIKATDSFSMPQFNKNDSFAAIMAKKSKIKPKPRLTVRRISWVAGMAASLFVAFGVYYFLSNNNTQISAAYAMNEAYSFPDNSSVQLNDGSSIEFKESNWESNRLVNLTGEAFFQVEKGNSFVVETKNGLVEVLGTEFNVRAWGENFYVECYEGSVAVRSNGQNSLLTEGQSVNVIDGKMEPVQPIVNAKPLWTNNESRFYKEDLNIVFDEIARQFGLEIKAPVLDKTYTGTFSHASPDTALLKVCLPMGLKYQIDETNSLVTISE